MPYGRYIFFVIREPQNTVALQDDVAACFEYYAGLAEKLDERQDQELDLGEDGFTATLRREPLGAVALITPWNYPMLMATVRHSFSRACLTFSGTESAVFTV